MKNFIFGGLVFLCLGAGIANKTELLTVKPARPKSTVIVGGFMHEINKNIKPYIQKGFVVKSIASDGYVTVVMEKY